MTERRDTIPGDVPLSAAGQARRDAMLDVLAGAMRARVRGRRIARSGALMVLLAAAGVAAFTALPRKGGVSGSGLAGAGGSLDAAAGLTMRYASFREVGTDAMILDDAGTNAAPRVVRIDDDRLLEELRALGHPTGLIRVHGSVVLTADIGLKTAPANGVPGNG